MKSPAITQGSESEKKTFRPSFVEPADVLVEEDERGEAGGADRIALGDRLRRVAHRVQRVGDGAHRLVEIRHLGDASGVIRHGPVRIEGDDEARHGKLRHDGHADSEDVLPGGVERADDAGRDDDHRQGRRLHAPRQAGDDVRRVPGLRRLGDRLHRTPATARVVLGDSHEEKRHGEADEGRPVQLPEVELLVVEGERDGDEADRGQHRRDDNRLVQRVHDRPVATDAGEERPYYRGEDRDAADCEREQPELARREGRREQHHGHRRNCVRLEEVGSHARAVADVVPDVVRDHSGVPRVVLRDARLDLPHEVCPYVGRFREDAAAKPCEDGDEGATECESDEVVDRRVGAIAEPVREHPVVARDAE